MQGTAIVRLPDQDSTDFTKTAQHLLTLRKSGEQKVSTEVCYQTVSINLGGNVLLERV